MLFEYVALQTTHDVMLLQLLQFWLQLVQAFGLLFVSRKNPSKHSLHWSTAVQFLQSEEQFTHTSLFENCPVLHSRANYMIPELINGNDMRIITREVIGNLRSFIYIISS